MHLYGTLFLRTETKSFHGHPFRKRVSQARPTRGCRRGVRSVCGVAPKRNWKRWAVMKLMPKIAKLKLPGITV